MAYETLKYILGLVLPAPMMGLSLLYFFLTFLTNPLLPFTNFESYKEKAFAKLWRVLGPASVDTVPPQLPQLLANSKGLILDVGPGSGEQVKRFGQTQNISAIYGVEPGVSLHDRLRQKAAEAGLGGKYHVLSATADLDAIIPELMKKGLIKEGRTSSQDLQLFDEIVCLRVLCGVPDQATSVADLYSLLKPGGKFILCEHVRNNNDVLASLMQQLYMLCGWKYIMGGCCLTRNTLDTFVKVANTKDGGFAKVEVTEHDPQSTVVTVVGVLTKKS